MHTSFAIRHTLSQLDGHDVHIYRFDPNSSCSPNAEICYAVFCHVLNAYDPYGRATPQATSTFDQWVIQALFEQHHATVIIN